MSQFLNDPDDIGWLKSTALKGVPLPSRFADFKSFVIYGTEDYPEKVALYQSSHPTIYDACLHVVFRRDIVYAEAWMGPPAE